MTDQKIDVEKETGLQAVRSAVRSRSLSRLKQAFERPWPRQMLLQYQDSAPSGVYRIFEVALQTMPEKERKRAFQWTWDCYHPYMSDLGRCLEDLDGYIKGNHL